MSNPFPIVCFRPLCGAPAVAALQGQNTCGCDLPDVPVCPPELVALPLGGTCKGLCTVCNQPVTCTVVGRRLLNEGDLPDPTPSGDPS